MAKVHITRYCKEGGLQFISLARRSSRLRFSKKHGVGIYSVFDFDFSGDGESNNHGSLYMHGLKLEKIDLPAYRIN